MTQYVEFQLADGTKMLVESEEIPDETYRRVSAGRPEQGKLVRTFTDALEAVRPAASEMLDKLRSLDAKPTEVEVKFGLKLSGKIGAFIASTSSDANFEVTLKWKRSEE